MHIPSSGELIQRKAVGAATGYVASLRHGLQIVSAPAPKQPPWIDMRLPLCLAVLMTLSFSARSDDVPYAVPSSSRLGSPSQTYFASLGDIMMLNQLRHMKLQQAGATGNWALAAFEIVQLRDTFSKAAMFYDNIPIDEVLSINAPLDTIEHAAMKKDPAAFANGFAALTQACNGCHQSAKVGFIVISVPAASPFSDEKF